MIGIEKELAEISTKLEQELKAVEVELKYLPKGRLVCEKQGGKYRFVKELYVDKKRRRKNLKPDDPELTGLVRRRIFEAKYERLKESVKALKAAAAGVKDFNLNFVLFELKKTLPALDDNVISAALSDGEPDSWAAASYDKLSYQDERTVWHTTTFGLRVRSKSELLIAEMLHKYNLPFRYEQMLYFDNSSLAPDFTIKRSDGKLFYWEHEGLTDSQDYLNRQLKKSQIYAMNRIVPWNNLIVTYDNADGVIDLRIVESEIRNKLLI